MSKSSLKLVFDSPVFWKSFNRITNGDTPATGLFGSVFKSPKDFARIVQEKTQQADRLVDLVCSKNSSPKLTVKRLDRLSDMICSIVDSAEVVRHIHPDPQMSQAANSAHVSLSNYLNRLNTHTGLYKVDKDSNSPGPRCIFQ